MTTSSPGIWVTDPDAYRKRLMALVGNRDPIDVLSTTAAALEGVAAENPPNVMRARPFEGKWTPNEVIGHLIDAEWVYGYRMRQILCEDSPEILGMDQDRWVAGQRYNERQPTELVQTFRAMRGFNLALWKQISPEDLERTGRHNERGPESLAIMLPMLAGHDLWHLDQINRYLTAIRER